MSDDGDWEGVSQKPLWLYCIILTSALFFVVSGVDTVHAPGAWMFAVIVLCVPGIAQVADFWVAFSHGLYLGLMECDAE